MQRTIALAILLVLGSAPSGCNQDVGASRGGEGQLCHADDTCDSGLACVAGWCEFTGVYCGDGLCSGGESFSTCAEDCDILCGDGVCDEGETSDFCPMDCPVPPYCGDGVCNGDETVSSCFDDCPVQPYCGDGICNGDETVSSCFDDCRPPPECGDGFTEGDEVCDGADLGVETCTSQGFISGALACLADCSGYDTAACLNCGNSLIDIPEVCDGTDMAGQNCMSLGLGFNTGELTCLADCTDYDTSGCDTVPCTDLSQLDCRICTCQQYSSSCNWFADRMAYECYCGPGSTCLSDCAADCANPSLFNRTPACQACLDTASANSDPCFQVAFQACTNYSPCVTYIQHNQDCN